MLKSNIYKLSAVVLLIGVFVGVAVYLSLSNRHRAIVKTTVLHKLHILDPDWQVEAGAKRYKMVSPAFLIDGIYKSMEGPKASRYISLSTDSSLVWLTGFEVKAIDAKTNERVSNDFICHMNVDFNDVAYFSGLGLDDRIGKQYPRLTSLSHGMEQFRFPKGYGVPMRGNDLLYVTTQTLNHNLPDISKKVRHEVDIDYTGTRLKPLMSRTAFIMLPYDKRDPYKEPTDPGSNQCVPVETKNHSYDDGKGNMMSGHWVVPVGRRTYRGDITGQLQIADSLRLHAAAIHVHPFATRIAIYDKTTKTLVFESLIRNHASGIGLDEIEPFASETGVWIYAGREYEMVLDVDNTSGEPQDMMGSMFLFFYDAELDRKLSTSR